MLTMVAIGRSAINVAIKHKGKRREYLELPLDDHYIRWKFVVRQPMHRHLRGAPIYRHAVARQWNSGGGT